MIHSSFIHLLLIKYLTAQLRSQRRGYFRFSTPNSTRFVRLIWRLTKCTFKKMSIIQKSWYFDCFPQSLNGLMQLFNFNTNTPRLMDLFNLKTAPKKFAYVLYLLLFSNIIRSNFGE